MQLLILTWGNLLKYSFLSCSSFFFLTLKEFYLYEQFKHAVLSSFISEIRLLSHLYRWKSVGEMVKAKPIWVSYYFGNKIYQKSRYIVSINNFNICPYTFLIQIWAKLYKCNISNNFLDYRVYTRSPVILFSVPEVGNHASGLFFKIFYLSFFCFVFFPPFFFISLSSLPALFHMKQIDCPQLEHVFVPL